MENLQHFILSNREVRYNQQAKTYHYIIDTNIKTNLPLRYTPFEFEPRYYTEESWIPNAVTDIDQDFVNTVVAAAKTLPAH
ncbi:MAG TPA: hypothetical protein VM187_08610, partial [Niastella sp.]|nr:hypothetical protein [Niastella sp.]